MNSAPGSEQHDHKRHKHHGIVIAVGLVAVGIIVAGVYAFSSGGSQSRPAAARTAASSESSLPERVTGFAGRGTPVAAPPAAATPSPTPKPAATSTPKPKSTPTEDAGTDPGSLDNLSVLDAYKFSVHYEATGSVAADFYKSLRALVTDRPELLPKYTASPDKLLTIDYLGSFIYPDSLYTQWKVGTLRYSEWQVGTNAASQYNDEPVQKQTTSRFSITNNAAHQFWEGQIKAWFDDDETLQLRCRATSEKINGEKVRQCTVYQPTLDQAFALMDRFLGQSVETVDEASFAVWLMGKDNVPVRVSVKFSGKDTSGKATRLTATMDITDVNSSAIKVQVPK